MDYLLFLAKIAGFSFTVFISIGLGAAAVIGVGLLIEHMVKKFGERGIK